MAYNELTLVDKQTVIDAALLNHFQEGIKNAHNMVEGFRIEHVGRTTDAEGRVVDQYKVIVPSGEEYSFDVTGGKDGAPGEKGDPGLPGNITLNGAELKFFVGTKAEFDALPSQKNVFAIITDDPTQVGVVDAVTGFLNGTLPVPAAANDGNNDNIAETYVRRDTLRPQYAEIFGTSGPQNVWVDSKFKVGELPNGKTLTDIIGIGFEMDYVSTDTTDGPYYLDFSACRIKKHAISNPEMPPSYWTSEIPFQATSICGVNSGCGIGLAFMRVLLTEENGAIYAKFLLGCYTALNGKPHFLPNYASPLPTDKFTISSFCYQFA